MRMYDRPLWSLTAAGISLGDGLGSPPAAGPLSFRPPAQYDPGDGRMVPTRQGRSTRRSSRGQSLYHARTTRWRSFADGTGSHSTPCRNNPRAPGPTRPRAETTRGRRVLPDPAPKHARGRRVLPDPVPKQPQGAGSYPIPCRNSLRAPGRTRPRASRATVPGHDCPHVTPPPAGYCPSPITNPSVAVRNHPPVTHPHEPSRRRPSSPSPHGGEGAGG